MDVEQETPDRHGREPAIIDQLVPVRGAVLVDVAAEGVEQVAGVAVGQPALAKFSAQCHAERLGVA